MPKTTAKSARNVTTKTSTTRRHVEGLKTRTGRQRLDGARAKKAPARKRPVGAVSDSVVDKKGRTTGPALPGPAKAASADQPPQARQGRRIGRGSAPWAARHAAKQAAETAARNSAPPPPGSARATLRTPEAADEIKERVRQLHVDIGRIGMLQRSVGNSFYDIGLLLAEIRDHALYEAKGYSSLESFLDREVSLGRVQALRLLRVVDTFKREAAESLGLELLGAALRAIDELCSTRPARPLEPPRLGRGPLRQR